MIYQKGNLRAIHVDDGSKSQNEIIESFKKTKEANIGYGSILGRNRLKK
ncbi:hypothetical protein ACVXZ0_11615 [Staphylococcus aureus]